MTRLDVVSFASSLSQEGERNACPVRFRCKCLQPFTGLQCETIPWNKNPCNSNPCLFGGSCTVVPKVRFHEKKNSHAHMKCTCQQGFTGVFCQTIISTTCHLSTHPDGTKRVSCFNGGICRSTDHDYTCACPSVFTGNRCESPVHNIPPDIVDNNSFDNWCVSLPSLSQTFIDDNAMDTGDLPAIPGFEYLDVSQINEPNMVDEDFMDTDLLPQIPGFEDMDIEDFMGIYFKRQGRSPRTKNPCLHGAKCILRRGTSYTCVCPAGTRGKHCIAGCPHGYYGNKCQQKCGHCSSKTCNPTSGVCGRGTCQPGWRGKFCKSRDGLTVRMGAKLSGNFRPSLSNHSSPEYSKLEQDFTSWTHAACDQGVQQPCYMSSVFFEKGSVKVDFTILFRSNSSTAIDRSKLTKGFQEKSGDFPSDEYAILPNSIVVKDISVTSIITEGSENIYINKQTLIMVILGLGVLILCSLMGIYLNFKQKKFYVLHHRHRVQV